MSASRGGPLCDPRSPCHTCIWKIPFGVELSVSRLKGMGKARPYLSFIVSQNQIS
jgi:hypothetical protein